MSVPAGSDSNLSTRFDLVELSKSKGIDIWVALSQLPKSKRGVQDFLCNQLYSFSDHVIEFFLPQLCNLLLKDPEAQSLLRFLFDKCESLQLAIKIFFWFQASVEDNIYPRRRTNWLWHECEMAAINSKSRSALRLSSFACSDQPSEQSPLIGSLTIPIPTSQSNEAVPISKSAPVKVKHVRSASAPVNNYEEHYVQSYPSDPSFEANTRATISTKHSPKATTRYESLADMTKITDEELFNSKKARHQYFHQELQFISCLTEISTTLKKRGYKSKTEKNKDLYNMLKKVQQEIVESTVEPNILELGPAHLKRGLYLPLCPINNAYYRVIRILPGESFSLSSRDRVPFMLFVETLAIGTDDITDSGPAITMPTPEQGASVDIETPPSVDRLIEALDSVMTINREHVIHAGSGTNLSLGNKAEEDWVLMNTSESTTESSTIKLAYPEYWSEKAARIRKTSPFGSHPKWTLCSVIVKSGDDLRQEQLAVQLISTFHKILKNAELPLWLYSYSVIATSSDTGLIETIPDAISLDTLKKRIPNVKTLDDYFVSAYGDKTSLKFLQAQRNFVESLAGYSLVCYLLQLKDRHNGNILIDKEGHIIHIDYGFMLTSSPGSLGFETAPFKLTDEFLKVMGGDHSDMANYFKLLLIRGFLEVRKHYFKILLIAELLLPGYKMGCFARRDVVIKELKERFQLHLTDKECVTFIGNLIQESARNWRTESYDSYQYYLNGILT